MMGTPVTTSETTRAREPAEAEQRRPTRLSRFFPDVSSMRIQFEWRVAAMARRGVAMFEEVHEPGVCRFFGAGLDQFFTQEITSDFLNCLRRLGQARFRAGHASSPQVELYTAGCMRGLGCESTPARYRYVFVLGPRNGKSGVRITVSPSTSTRRFSFLPRFGWTHAIEACYGELIVHDAAHAFAVEPALCKSDSLLSATVLLSGHLW